MKLFLLTTDAKDYGFAKKAFTFYCVHKTQAFCNPNLPKKQHKRTQDAILTHLKNISQIKLDHFPQIEVKIKNIYPVISKILGAL